ncbi:hypothetical protein EVAR_47318_1 [Eumeta japonica]|uniref:Uncharacterized protein n=1 Tax=Eumeta variegata TaxID=151549 RepID=A0A4C1YFY2_EUMVA|nr:hypothetical protein EVAR_47318_1 [Eumeta japonica]
MRIVEKWAVLKGCDVRTSKNYNGSLLALGYGSLKKEEKKRLQEPNNQLFFPTHDFDPGPFVDLDPSRFLLPVPLVIPVQLPVRVPSKPAVRAGDGGGAAAPRHSLRHILRDLGPNDHRPHKAACEEANLRSTRFKLVIRYPIIPLRHIYSADVDDAPAPPDTAPLTVSPAIQRKNTMQKNLKIFTVLRNGARKKKYISIKSDTIVSSVAVTRSRESGDLRPADKGRLLFARAVWRAPSAPAPAQPQPSRSSRPLRRYTGRRPPPEAPSPGAVQSYKAVFAVPTYSNTPNR